VLSYDRPGLAWSDPGPAPRSFKQDVYELHKLLEKLNISPPYILAGHSVGGIIAREYAKEYPAEVSGMLLLDATSENSSLMVNGKVQQVRMQASGKTLPPLKYKIDSLTKVPSQKDADDFFKMTGRPSTNPPFDKLPANIQQIRIWAASQPKFLIADDDPFWADEFQQMYIDSAGYRLGNIPLIVLSSIRNDYPKELGDSLRNAMITDKIKNHSKMLGLSTNSKKIVTDKSGHEIHLTEPELVVSAIKEIIDSSLSGKKLGEG
jgi:pimeloyl-ACP methyl ester carboxylesterase